MSAASPPPPGTTPGVAPPGPTGPSDARPGGVAPGRGPSDRPGPPRLPVGLLALVLLVVPLVAVGPALLPGHRLLPQLPVASAPLATEDPAAAAAALDGSNVLTADRLFPVLTDQRAAREQLADGTLPTWDPTLGLGVPLFAASIAALAYPPNWLALALPPDLAAAPLALASLVLAGLGMALFLRRRGLGEPAVLVGALAMQASTWALANLGYFMKVDAALWLPWMLLGVDLLCDPTARARRRGGLTLALATGLAFLAGFPPIAIFALATAGLVALVRALVPRAMGADAPARPVALVTAAAFVALGLGLGAWQVLPTVEASEHSRRVPRTAEVMVGEALPTATTWGLVLPDLFGAPDVPRFGAPHPIAAGLTATEDGAKLQAHNALEWNTHLGQLALLLALVALVATPRRAWLPATLVLLWLGFAQAWPGVRWLYHVPGLNLGAPARALAAAWPLMAWLAALGTEALATGLAALDERAPDGAPGRSGARRAASLACIGGAVLALVTTWSLARFELTGLRTLLARGAGGGHGLSVDETLDLLGRAAVDGELTRVLAAGGALLAASLTLAAAGLLAATGRRLGGQWNLPLGAALGLTLALVPRALTGALELPAPEALVLAGGAALVLALGLGFWLRRAARAEAGPLPPGLPPSPAPATRARAALALVLGLAMVGEALDVAPPHLRARTVTDLVPASPAMDAVAAATRPGDGGALDDPRAPLDGRVLRWIPGGVGEAVGLARPNLPSLYGLRDLTPYMVFTPRTLVELVEAVDPAAAYLSGIAGVTEPAALGAPVLDALGVAAVLSMAPAPTDPRLEPLHAAPGFHVTRRAGALPPAWLVDRALVAADDAAALALLTAVDFDPRALVVLGPEARPPADARVTAGPTPAPRLAVELPADQRDHARWSRPAANRMDVEVVTADGAWLVLGEQFYPGWKATVGGRDATVLRADHALRALWVPPGEHLVRTWYEPWSLRLGAGLAALSLAVLLGIVLAGGLGDRRRRRAAATGSDSAATPAAGAPPEERP